MMWKQNFREMYTIIHGQVKGKNGQKKHISRDLKLEHILGSIEDTVFDSTDKVS